MNNLLIIPKTIGDFLLAGIERVTGLQYPMSYEILTIIVVAASFTAIAFIPAPRRPRW